MADIFPFRGYIPRKDITLKVVSRPYDKYLLKEVEQIVAENPFSFLHIIKPELVKGIKSNPEQPEELKKSREKFEEFAQSGVFHQTDKPSYFIYRQSVKSFTYTGVIATIAASDYRNGNIRIHEQTLSRKEEKLKEYLKVVGINAEPVMFTYPHCNEIDSLVERLTGEIPYADFEMDGKRHQLWCVQDSEDVNSISQSFKSVNHVYVADGHHRSASSVLLAEELSAGLPNPRHKTWMNFMGVFFPDNNLQLFEFNRLLKDLNGLSRDSIFDGLKKIFYVDEVQAETFKPQERQMFSMYFQDKWYCLKFRESMNISENQLDADLLNQYILAPLFGITDLRMDPRIDFLPGIEGPEEMKRRVDSGRNAIAFGLYPVSFHQFFRFSDEGKIMPPKTTWFEPKLLNALVVFDLEINK